MRNMRYLCINFFVTLVQDFCTVCLLQVAQWVSHFCFRLMMAKKKNSLNHQKRHRNSRYDLVNVSPISC